MIWTISRGIRAKYVDGWVNVCLSWCAVFIDVASGGMSWCGFGMGFGVMGLKYRISAGIWVIGLFVIFKIFNDVR